MSRRVRRLAILVLLPALGLWALLLWWWLSRERREETVAAPRRGVAVPRRGVEAPVPVPERAPAGPDDLKRIEGIGPKIAGALEAAGIRTYAHLASMEESQLREIIREAGIRIGFPATWPEQARLAAAGEWEALEAFQAKLKGGRRV